MIELNVNGKTVHAGTGGVDFRNDLPLVLFLHGAGSDHTVWALQARFFAHHGYAVLALDLPGHGRSEGPALTTIKDVAAWTVAVIEAAGADQAILVGHSMGALAALHAAGYYPDRVAGLALLGATARMPVHDSLLAAARDDPGLANDLIISWAYGRRAQKGGMRAPGLWMLGGGRRLLERCEDGVLHADFAACNDYKGGARAAARVRCPTVVLCGDNDRMTPAAAAKSLVTTIDQAQLEMVRGGGHFMMIEQPDATLDALRRSF